MRNLIWREESRSTNHEMRSLETEDWTVLVTSNQSAGRGRLDRRWVTPPDSALAVSVLLPVRDWGAASSLAPLVVASAVKAALAPLIRTAVKWPNDVLVTEGSHTGRKICGVLCELLDTQRVIAGTGVNLLTAEADLPVDTATSVRAAGGDAGGATTISSAAGHQLATVYLERYVSELQRLSELAVTDAAALHARLEADSGTLGQHVRVVFPDGSEQDGRARRLTLDGGLVLSPRDSVGDEVTVYAGDVQHLRNAWT